MTDKYLSHNEIIKINNEINQETDKIKTLQDIIKSCQNNINNLQNILKTKCLHKKQIDTSIVSEHTEYYCNVCNLNL
jgi:hypothetical protein